MLVNFKAAVFLRNSRKTNSRSPLRTGSSAFYKLRLASARNKTKLFSGQENGTQICNGDCNIKLNGRYTEGFMQGEDRKFYRSLLFQLQVDERK